MDLCVVIVIYNSAYDQTNSYRSLVKCSSNCSGVNFHLLIYDNSKNAQNINKECLFETTEYYHDERNLGVIPAYQYAINYCENHSIKWLLRLDQDSVFDEKLINSFLISINDCKKALCYVPKIYSSGKMISPSIIRLGGFWGKLPNDFYGVPSQKVTFINSMSFVDASNKLIQRYLRESCFMLDLSDHELAYRLDVSDVYILNINVTHSLSVMESDYVKKDRYCKILKAEILFSKQYYTLKDKIVFRFRLLVRCVKHLLYGRFIISYYTIKNLFR